MKLDATDLRYITAEEFRVLKAFEQGSKNHEIVPTPLVAQISGLRHSGINKLIGSLAKRNLVARVQNASYDGYRLTYGGYDYLAIRALSKDDSIVGVGQQIGVGKESDIYIVQGPEEERRILKIHRLGRISFRAVKEKRDYMGKRKSASWMYLSKLAAMKEYAFMQILYQYGFPVPKPFSQSRHCIVMSLIDNAYPLRQVAALPAQQIPLLFSKLMKLIVRFARAGLIHGDFNEFNLLIREIQPEEDAEYEGGESAWVSREAALEAGSGKTTGDRHAPLEVEDGQRVESGRGFERIIADPASQPNQDGQDEDSESEDEVEGDDEEEDGERITFESGARIEPIVIDFPQMTSVEHENAEEFFNRDVQCVRRFFRKRFRYISDDYPKFREVVPVDREKRRHAAAEALRQNGKVLSVQDEDAQIRSVENQLSSVHHAGDGREEGEELELDALVKASGFGAGSRMEKQLEDHMRRIRLGSTAAPAEEASSGEEEVDSAGEEEEGQDQDEQEDDEVADPDAEESEDDEEDNEESERSKKGSKKSLPSRGAAEKALAEGDQRLIAMRVAADRARQALKAEKHHGKKAHGAKVGRSHPGGKGKSDVVKNASIDF